MTVAMFLLVAWGPCLEAPGPFQCLVMVRVRWFSEDARGAADGAAVQPWLPTQFLGVHAARQAGRVEGADALAALFVPSDTNPAHPA